jgi:hypothetical protein
MNPRVAGVVMGFFAGAFVASIVPLAPLPKAALVGVVAVLVSTLVWAVFGPEPTQQPTRLDARNADDEGTSDV